MQIAWESFTLWGSLAGGLVIGLATAIYLLGVGRVAGIAGIVASPLHALRTRSRMAPETVRLAFIAGLLAAPWVWSLFRPLPAAPVDVGNGGLLLAGLLVGVGARLGNGCTSGHGVCGLSRFSRRSLVNVLAFIGTGMATVYVLRHP